MCFRLQFHAEVDGMGWTRWRSCSPASKGKWGEGGNRLKSHLQLDGRLEMSTTLKMPHFFRFHLVKISWNYFSQVLLGFWTGIWGLGGWKIEVGEADVIRAWEKFLWNHWFLAFFCHFKSIMSNVKVLGLNFEHKMRQIWIEFFVNSKWRWVRKVLLTFQNFLVLQSVGVQLQTKNTCLMKPFCKKFQIHY